MVLPVVTILKLLRTSKNLDFAKNRIPVFSKVFRKYFRIFLYKVTKLVLFTFYSAEKDRAIKIIYRLNGKKIKMELKTKKIISNQCKLPPKQ